MKQQDVHPGEAMAEVLRLIYQKGLTTASGGNISVRGAHNSIWITPKATDKGKLQGSQVVKVRATGNYQGEYAPSSELPFHKAILEARPDLGAVVHAHPPALVSFSIVHQVPDTRLLPQVRRVCGEVGYAPYALTGSDALGESIARVFREGRNCVLMENHGAVVGGKDLREAFERFELLEHSAQIQILAEKIAKLSEESLALRPVVGVQTVRPDYYAYSPTKMLENEESLREELKALVRRAFRQGLFQNFYGTVSARLDEDHFLISPEQYERSKVTEQEFVKIFQGKNEEGKVPDDATFLHELIYRHHPEINFIIGAQPPSLTAFAILRKVLDTRTIPESYFVLRDVPLVSHLLMLERRMGIPNRLSKQTKMLLIENQGVLVTGASLFETFDRLEVAEFSALSLIESRALGEMKPISDDKLSVLRERFF